MKNHVIGVTEFKAKCLALLDGVGERGDTITITKRGKPIATVEPAPKQKKKPRRLGTSENILAGKIYITEELLNIGLSNESERTRRDDV